MLDVTKRHFKMMIQQIDNYKDNKIKLITAHDNIESLFDLIMDDPGIKNFDNIFHKYWDHIEEIIAIEKVDVYRDEINNSILPEFKKEILEYLSRYG